MEATEMSIFGHIYKIKLKLVSLQPQGSQACYYHHKSSRRGLGVLKAKAQLVNHAD